MSFEALTDEQRLKEYVKFAETKSSVIEIPISALKKRKMFYSRLYRNNNAELPKKHAEDFKRLFEIAKVQENAFFLCSVGDNRLSMPFPTFCKSGPVADTHDTCVFLKLNCATHWKPVHTAHLFDKRFEDKIDRVLWRGSSTGWCVPRFSGHRATLVQKFGSGQHADIDVAVVNWCQNVTPITPTAPRMSIENQLKYKYIVSVEGNDVASNLKWILASNSVPLMPQPTMRSWCLEDLLQPYTHYVPLKNDFSDLVQQYEWCKTHQNECLNIVENGKKWIAQFMDKEREERLQTSVIKKYFETCKFIQH